MPLLPFSGPVIPTPVPISRGGTGSATQNFVDLSSTQTVGGAKTWAGVATYTTTGGSQIVMKPASGTIGGNFKLDTTALGGKQYTIFSGASGDYGGVGGFGIYDNTDSRCSFFIGSDGNLYPGLTNNTVNFGSASHYLNNLYATTLNLNSTFSIGGGTAGLGTITGQLKFAAGTTGSGSAALGANSPAVTNTAPYTWLQVTASDGSQLYVPAWK